MDSANILIVTFNAGRKPVKPDIFSRHLGNACQSESSPDIIVFALQEIAPIAYAFLGGTFLSYYYNQLLKTIELTAKTWQSCSYLNIFRKNVGMTALLIFVKNDLADCFHNLQWGMVGVGVLEMGNKGAVGARVDYASEHGPTTLTFVSAHLAAMEDAVERRNQDWINIVQRLVFGVDDKAPSSIPTTVDLPGSGQAEESQVLLPSTDRGIYSEASYAFVAGDLNYRTSDRKPSPRDFPQYPQSIEDCREFFKRDQLMLEMQAARTMHGFVEPPVEFSPTYKYSDLQRSDVNVLEQSGPGDHSQRQEDESHFGWAKHRWPSWCDRILFIEGDPEPRSPMEARLKVIQYRSLPLTSTSDHRGVLLLAELPLQAPSEVGPLGQKHHLQSPFPLDPRWRQKRAAARRLEVAVGLLAYISTTPDGAGLLLALLMGALGGWALVTSLII